MTTPLEKAGLIAERRIKTLERQLAEAKSQARILLKTITELESMPQLRPVTPEVMAEIKRRDVAKILFVTPFTDADGKQFVSHNILHWYHDKQQWYEEDDFPAEDNEFSHDYFIDLLSIPEVQ